VAAERIRGDDEEIAVDGIGRAGEAFARKEARDRDLLAEETVRDGDRRELSAAPFVHERNGSVENRFPLGDPAPAVIPLGANVEIGPPYGIDAYFLLTTDEPLPDPGVLSLEAVRTRAGSVVTPSTWSIEQVLFESVPPAKKVR